MQATRQAAPPTESQPTRRQAPQQPDRHRSSPAASPAAPSTADGCSRRAAARPGSSRWRIVCCASWQMCSAGFRRRQTLPRPPPPPGRSSPASSPPLTSQTRSQGWRSSQVPAGRQPAATSLPPLPALGPAHHLRTRAPWLSPHYCLLGSPPTPICSGVRPGRQAPLHRHQPRRVLEAIPRHAAPAPPLLRNHPPGRPLPPLLW